MSNVHQLPSQEIVYETASRWIAQLDRELSKEEENELRAWMNENPFHREVLFNMATVWDSMDSLSRLSDLFDSPEEKVKTKPWPFIASMAASFLVVCVTSLWFALSSMNVSTKDWIASFYQSNNIDGIYETEIGEHSRVNLPDGSELVLNTNSKIQVRYTQHSRLFYLQRGEAHIEVAHDTSRPLSVIASDKVVQAVGTAFNVQIYNDREIELIVTDGKVLVAKHDQSSDFKTIKQSSLPKSAMAISKGEKIVLGSKNQSIAKLDDKEIDANLSWREGNLVFSGETLEQALAEISRYTEVKFAIQEAKIRHIRIAGRFKAGDITGLLNTLEHAFNIDSHYLNDDTVSLKSL